MASQPTKQWTVTGSDKGFDGLEFRDGKVPDVGDTDVLVKFHAASINYRDLIIPKVPIRLVQHDSYVNHLLKLICWAFLG